VPEIHIEIKLSGEFPSDEELYYSDMLEDLIHEREIGDVVGAGAGMGARELEIKVKNGNRALKQLQALLVELHLDQITTMRKVIRRTRKRPPLFRPGDCIVFSFPDSDYGGVLALAVNDDQQHPWYGAVLGGRLNYKKSTKPTLSDFAARHWSGRTNDFGKFVPAISWHIWGSEKIVLENIGSIELHPDDLNESNTVSPWFNLPLG
jgi:hypothetical protein